MANFPQENNYTLNNLAAQSRQEQLPGPVQLAEQPHDYLFTFTTEMGGGRPHPYPALYQGRGRGAHATRDAVRGRKTGGRADAARLLQSWHGRKRSIRRWRRGYAYQQGQQTTRCFRVSGGVAALTLSQRTKSEYQPSYATYRAVLHGLPAALLIATVDEQPVPLSTHLATETTVAAPALVVSTTFKELKVTFELGATTPANVA